MNDYIIFLKGINVGGNNILPMKNLKALLSNHGFENVRTYIQSGNILAKGARVTSKEISSLIEAEYGFSPETLVLDKKEFLEAIDNNPFNSSDGKIVHFYFCATSPSPDKEKIDKFKADSEEYVIRGNVFYLHAPDGIGKSKLVSNIESCLNTTATGRNLNTVRKMQGLANDA